jgi:hypothetical protein
MIIDQREFIVDVRPGDTYLPVVRDDGSSPVIISELMHNDIAKSTPAEIFAQEVKASWSESSARTDIGHDGWSVIRIGVIVVSIMLIIVFLTWWCLKWTPIFGPRP